MNRCTIQQSSFSACEEIWGTASDFIQPVEMRESVVCPKPRRLGLIHTIPFERSAIRPIWQEISDAKAGNELLDIIHSKDARSSDQSVIQLASSPPFFCGSPPSRVSNPLIKDARFTDEEFKPLSPFPYGIASSPTSSRKGSCVRATFGSNPASRIEGFDCLDRDRRNCTVSALA